MTDNSEKVTSSNIIGTVRKAFCSKCRGDRNCEVAGHRAESGDEDIYQWRRDWYLLACRGCDHIFAQSVGTNSEDYHHVDLPNGDYDTIHDETIESWPAKAKRQRPEWFEGGTIETHLQDTFALDASLVELYGALDHDLNVLASIGVRTSLDIASEILGIHPNLTFTQKIEDLVTKGFIRESEKEHIGTLIEAGSASAHRGWKPPISAIDALMDTLEDFIYNNMVLPARNKTRVENIAKVKAKVPARAKNAKRAKPASPSGS